MLQARSPRLSRNTTSRLRPGARSTRAKPLSCRDGSCAAGGDTRYSSAVAGPARDDVLVTRAVTVAAPAAGW